MAESTAKGFLGSGDLLIDLFVSGAYTGYTGPIECNSFAIKPNSERKELISKSRANYGQPVVSVNLPRPFDLTVGVTQQDKRTLAMAMFGLATPLAAQTSGTVTDEAHADVVRDTWIPMSKGKLSNVVVKVGSDVKANGTDYIYEPEVGLVKVLSTGTIAAAADILVSFSHAAITGTRIRGAAESVIKARFKLIGRNFVDGAPVIVTVHEATIAPDAAWDILADDFGTLEMPCRMNVPDGFFEPFTIDLRDL